MVKNYGELEAPTKVLLHQLQYNEPLLGAAIIYFRTFNMEKNGDANFFFIVSSK